MGPIEYPRHRYYEHFYQCIWYMPQRRLTHFFRFSFFHICLLRVNQFCFSIILLLLLCTSRYLLFIDYASGTKSEEKEKMMMVTFPSCPDFISSLKKNMLLIAISFPLARFLSSFIDKR